ncbi:MAG TPA: error-prone DNA polymerase [Polyangiales bacterium]|nr:error-prone DNA polymerase [Polyangiales bacterium]
MSPYVPLWVKSNHSFLEGASHPEQLMEQAKALGLDTLVITDRDGLYGAVKAHVRAKELGLKLILGAQVSLTVDLEHEAEGRGFSAHEPNVQHVVLLAKTRAGYAGLCRLLSIGRARKEKGQSLVSLSELRAAHEGLIALCAEPSLLASLKAAYGPDLFALCARHVTAEELPHEQVLRSRARALNVPRVAATEVLYHEAARRPLQDVLTCIRLGCTLRAAGSRIKPNAEHDLKPHAVMAARFADDQEALANTRVVADRCHFTFDEIRYRYPGEALPDGVSESEHLRTMTLAGAAHRFPEGVPADTQQQLEAELALIAELDYGGYFLTMHELVQYCRQNGILCQGRGSAANSVVCFCLGITSVDPIRMDLLFERFLSRERKEPPDIDLDIEHDRREEVIQWMYKRYGRRHAAMVANLIRYRVRSAVRDVGKVLGIPATELDGVARLLGHYADHFSADTLREAGLDPAAGAYLQLGKLCQEIKDFPRHLSIHPGGFLLGHEPVDSLVPIEPATMEGRTVIQWDKYDVEALGLFKVDLLGLGALTAIRHSLELLAKHKNLPLEMATVPQEDPDTYAMISRGETVGVFQIESRAQMSMLPRIKPRTFYDLVIEVAIVRPGPIQGDMVHPYLRRREGKEPVSYPHESFRRVLSKTLGVPIFQEQVMKLAILAADYSPGEADLLRRDMAAWRSAGRIEEHHDRLVGRMVARGVPEEFAERMFAQIRGFGEYGFPESHAASFALLAYITSWLRCHHPEVFLCAMLNAQPMGFYAPATLIEDAARQGVLTLPIDVNHSGWDCTLEAVDVPLPVPLPLPPLGRGRESGQGQGQGQKSFSRALAVRMGYRYVKGFGTREREALAYVPRPVRSIEEFARQSGLGLRSLVALAEAGAFDSLGLTRREALWRVRAASPGARDTMRSEPGGPTPRLPELGVGEQILWDYQSSQHSPRGHPMESLRPWMQQRGVTDASMLRNVAHGRSVDCVGLVICRQRPGTATGVVFLTLEDEHGFMNIVVWNNVFDRFQRVLRTARMLGVRGPVQSVQGVVHVIAEDVYVPELQLDQLVTRSRDFH